MPMASAGNGRVCVAVLRDAPPTQEEWSSWLTLLRARKGAPVRVLVETQSGPNASQRKALSDTLRDEDARFAILTDSLIVRGIVTALAWLGLPHHAFAPSQHVQACNYLDLSTEEREEAERELSRLRRKLDEALGEQA